MKLETFYLIFSPGTQQYLINEPWRFREMWDESIFDAIKFYSLEEVDNLLTDDRFNSDFENTLIEIKTIKQLVEDEN